CPPQRLALSRRRRFPATRPTLTLYGHVGRNWPSGFSRRTAKQTGHFLFEILVEILARRCRLSRLRLGLKLGLSLGFSLGFSLGLEFRLGFRLKLRFNTWLEITCWRTRGHVTGFGRRCGQLSSRCIGYRGPAFR